MSQLVLQGDKNGSSMTSASPHGTSQTSIGRRLYCSVRGFPVRAVNLGLYRLSLFGRVSCSCYTKSSLNPCIEGYATSIVIESIISYGRYIVQSENSNREVYYSTCYQRALSFPFQPLPRTAPRECPLEVPLPPRLLLGDP